MKSKKQEGISIFGPGYQSTLDRYGYLIAFALVGTFALVRSRFLNLARVLTGLRMYKLK